MEGTNQNLFIELFSSNGYITTSKYLIQKLGLLEAIFISELCSEYKYWETKIDDFDGWFPSTIENINSNCGISRRTQPKIVCKLSELKLIETKTYGLPAKRHFKINVNNLVALFKNKSKTSKNVSEEKTRSCQFAPNVQTSLHHNKNGEKNTNYNPGNIEQNTSSLQFAPNVQTRKHQTCKQVCTNGANSNNNIYNNINNNKHNNTSNTNSNFDIPTLKDVYNFAKCCVDDLFINPENFFYQNQVNGWIDKNGEKIENWKGLFIDWNQKIKNKKKSEEEDMKKRKERQDKHLKKLSQKYSDNQKIYKQKAVESTILNCPTCDEQFPSPNLFYDVKNQNITCFKCNKKWKAINNGDIKDTEGGKNV